jgi:integrative and conjugative element protein (TIGR02256 family)
MQLTRVEPRLWLHTAVKRHFLELPSGPCEVGGWLLGYWTANRGDVFVTHATPPGPRGFPWGVRISGIGHRERFDTAWTASEGQVTFLGDWHTHPGGIAAPSTRDSDAMTKLASKPDYGTPEPLIAIIETPRWPWSKDERRVRFFLRHLDTKIGELAPSVTTCLPESAARVPDWSWYTPTGVLHHFIRTGT